MSFLTPFMLFGAIAAAIPVIIHLFFRSRYRTVPWAAMKFLLTAVEQTSRRLRFQELLLLCLRMLLLVMLALAFARPISTIVRGTGRGDSVDAVFVIDTSFSMGANDGAKTRLERAQAEAIKIIDELPPHSTVQIVTCAGKTKAVIGPRAPANLDQAKALIKSLELTHLGTDLAVGVEEAKDVLTRGQASNKELYVFSDMQSTGFEVQAGSLKTTLTEIKEKAIVHFVRCGTRTIKNVAIVGITPQTGIPRPNERVGFAVYLMNTSSEPIHDINVTLMVDGDEKSMGSEKIPVLKGKDTYTASISVALGKAGTRVLTARVSHDELEGDNRFDQVIMVRDRVNILVVDGSPNDEAPVKASTFNLMHALIPVKEGEHLRFRYNPQVVSARLASAQRLESQDLCILVNCAVAARPGADPLPGHFIDALHKFVRKDGHGLIVFAGNNVDPKAYNANLAKLLPAPLVSVVTAVDKQPFLLNRQSVATAPPAFWAFKDDEKLFAELNEVPVRKHIEVNETVTKKAGDTNDDEAATVIMRLSSEKPIAMRKKAEAGEVIFVGTSPHVDILAPEANWAYLGTSPEFIPLMHVTVNYLMHTQTQTYNVVAGETLQWYPQDKQELAYYLVHPDLKTVSRLGVPTRDGKRTVVTASDLPRAGVYYMKGLPRDSESPESSIDAREAAKTGVPIAVIPDLSESADLTAKTNAEIDAFLGFEPIHLTAGEATASTGADRLNREWTVWVLLAVMALVLFEVVLAWWCGRGW